MPGINCNTYGSPSSHASGSFAALGQGTAVWLFDMTKWSGGRFNAGSFVGNVLLPVILAGVTDGGRAAGNYESGGQIVAGSLAGVTVGLPHRDDVRPDGPPRVRVHREPDLLVKDLRVRRLVAAAGWRYF